MTVSYAIRSDIMTMTEIDYYGLYEIIWELAPGDVNYPDFDTCKCCAWEEVRDVVIGMVDAGNVHVVKMTRGTAERVTGSWKDILGNRTSWLPYSMGSETGYALAKNRAAER